MTGSDPTRRRARPSEEGYILLWVIFLLAIVSLVLSVAAPRIAKEIQRDRERETVERGKQYVRAVQLYYRKFHAYPPNQDALVKTNEIRFLRKKYIDPTTGKDDWKPIHFGQNKTPMAMGFFGQPLAGSASTIAGTGPSGGNGINFTSAFAPANPGTGAAAPPAGVTGAAPSATPTTGAAGSSGGASPDTGLTGQTFGGAGIVGFEPASPKPSILIYKKKSHYNEWEFVYDPLADMKTISGNTGTIGQPAGNTNSTTGSPGFNNSPGPGNNPGPSNNPGFNNSPGSVSAPTTPASPQQ